MPGTKRPDSAPKRCTAYAYGYPRNPIANASPAQDLVPTEVVLVAVGRSDVFADVVHSGASRCRIQIRVLPRIHKRWRRNTEAHVVGQVQTILPVGGRKDLPEHRAVRYPQHTEPPRQAIRKSETRRKIVPIGIELQVGASR